MYVCMYMTTMEQLPCKNLLAQLHISHEYPVFMPIRVVMIPSDLDGLKDGIFLEKY